MSANFITNREPVCVALLALLQKATNFSNATRILKHWDSVPDTEMPYLCLVKGKEKAPAPAMRGAPIVWTWDMTAYIYVSRGNDETIIPSTLLNTALDAIELALQPTTLGERQTLGGLVHDCRIVGTIETDEGTLGTKSVAIVPFQIVARGDN